MKTLDEYAEEQLKDWPVESQALLRAGIKDLIKKAVSSACTDFAKEMKQEILALKIS